MDKHLPPVPLPHIPTNPVSLPGSSHSLMPPPAGYPPFLPPQQHCTGPDIHAPAVWPADSCVPTNPISLPGSSRSIMPPPAGYSKHHTSYSNSLNYWSHLARTPGTSLTETIVLNILALHKGGQRCGRLHGTPLGVSGLHLARILLVNNLIYVEEYCRGEKGY